LLSFCFDGGDETESVDLSSLSFCDRFLCYPCGIKVCKYTDSVQTMETKNAPDFGIAMIFKSNENSDKFKENYKEN
jgi:hypothetical protein